MPKRISLPSMFPPETCELRELRRGCGFGAIAKRKTAGEQHDHHRQQYPARAWTAGHMSEGHRERGRQHGDGQQREEIGQGRGVLIRMGAIGIEEAAAVGSQVLDELQRRHRSLSDGLTATFQSVGLRVRRQVERHALPDQGEAADHRRRQKHPKQRSYEIRPEVAHGSRMRPGEASDEGDSQGKSGRARKEVLRDQAK